MASGLQPGATVNEPIANSPQRQKNTVSLVFWVIRTAMNENEILRMVRALEELRDGQKLQLERQQEAIALQREQFVLVPIIFVLIVYVSWLIFR